MTKTLKFLAAAAVATGIALFPVTTAAAEPTPPVPSQPQPQSQDQGQAIPGAHLVIDLGHLLHTCAGINPVEE